MLRRHEPPRLVSTDGQQGDRLIAVTGSDATEDGTATITRVSGEVDPRIAVSEEEAGP
jgi:hypothetical protein